jgi:SNF2 family DNA or RNA helicase
VCGVCPAGPRGHVSLLNIITELKKTCNHPFLFESAEDEYRCVRSSAAGQHACLML